MGLDLMLYTKTKEQSFDDYKGWEELAYGRKTWAISDFFTEHCNCEPIDKESELYRVSEEDWSYFIEVVEFYFIKPEVVGIIEKYLNDEYFVEDEFEEDEEKLRKILDTALFGDIYYLGIFWEAAAVLNWYRADGKVREAFKKGQDVFLERSY